MATVGQPLTAPEAGWRRYDDNNGNISYSTGWEVWSDSYRYGGSCHFTTQANASVNFKFYGTKLRLISGHGNDHPNTNVIQVKIDGAVVGSFSQYHTSDIVGFLLSFELLGLEQKVHEVEIISTSFKGNIDAIDIDENGYLCHSVLNTVGSLDNMQVGDCIPCKYTAPTSGQVGYFSELGTCTDSEISLSGSATPNGLFYFIKADRGLLIADRILQHSISWNTLNSAGFIEGQYSPIDISPLLISYQKTTLGSPITDYYEYTARTTSSSHQGANLTIKKDEYLITSQDEVIIEYDAFLTGFYSSAINHFLHIIPYDSPLSRQSHYGFIEGGILFIHCQYSQPSLNVWHHMKHIINFSTETIENFVDGSSYTFPQQGFGTYTLGSIGMLCIGVGSYNYAAQNKYRNITIKNANSEPVLVQFTDQMYLISSLSGGCTYADANGNATTSDQNLGGWPTTNEWDTYIVNSDLGGKITKGDDNVWHWSNLYSWTKDTPITSIGANTNRVYRGKDSNNKLLQIAGSTANTTIGFRPVLEYIEPDGSSKQKTLWY